MKCVSFQMHHILSPPAPPHWCPPALGVCPGSAGLGLLWPGPGSKRGGGRGSANPVFKSQSQSLARPQGHVPGVICALRCQSRLPRGEEVGGSREQSLRIGQDACGSRSILQRFRGGGPGQLWALLPVSPPHSQGGGPAAGESALAPQGCDSMCHFWFCFFKILFLYP